MNNFDVKTWLNYLLTAVFQNGRHVAAEDDFSLGEWDLLSKDDGKMIVFNLQCCVLLLLKSST